MAPRVLALVTGTLVVVGVMSATAGPAKAEFCRPVMPEHASDATGYTFDAQVVAIRADLTSSGLTHIAMAVSHVYANRDSARLAGGHPIDLTSNLCDGFGLLGFHQGDEILMSTAFLEAGDGPSTWNTAVWRRHGEELDLLVLHGQGFDRVWFTNDRRILDAKATEQALALVAPGAIPAPGDDTDPIDPGGVLWLAAVVAAIVAGVVGLFVVELRRRERNAH